MTRSPNVDRRDFVVGASTLASGLALGFHVPLAPAVAATAADAPVSPEINAWVVVKPDDTIVIRIVRSEMGQGTLTGLAQLVAEELECDWSKVVTEYPTPGQSLARKRPWGEFMTGGSRGIRASQDYVRKGGAAARAMLVQAAANAWGVPPGECVVAKGVITHEASGRATTYGKVAEAAAKLPPPAEVALKDPRAWSLAGKSLKRLDTADKTTGRMIYGIDFALPGMLHAAIKDCPVFGGKLKSFDESKISGLPGVKKVVRVGETAVAVIADGWWRAKVALDALPVVWDEGPEPKEFERLDRGVARGRPQRRRAGGDRQQRRRRQGGGRQGRENGRGGLQLPLPESRGARAFERDRPFHGRSLRGLDRHAERRGGAHGGGESLRPA